MVLGKSLGPYGTCAVRTIRADSSRNDGGFNEISSTKRTTSGFSRRDSCKQTVQTVNKQIEYLIVNRRQFVLAMTETLVFLIQNLFVRVQSYRSVEVKISNS